MSNDPGSVIEMKPVEQMSVDEGIEHLQRRFADIRRQEEALRFQQGKYNDELRVFLLAQGMPENFGLIDAIAHFRKKLITPA